jgi:hypothetical protein
MRKYFPKLYGKQQIKYAVTKWGEKELVKMVNKIQKKVREFRTTLHAIISLDK